MNGYQAELCAFLCDSYPCIPFTAKKNAKSLFEKLTFFEEDEDRSWIDTQPQVVLTAFILFFTKKRLHGGVSFDGYDRLVAEDAPIRDRIKRFMEMNTVPKTALTGGEKEPSTSELCDSRLDKVDVTLDDNAHKRARHDKDDGDVKAIANVLVILVGIPGSGKSTLANSLVETLGRNRVKIISQDELGSREACERDAHMYLADPQSGHVVLIDRTNITRDQRSIWVKIGQRYKAKCLAVVFDVKPEVCIDRARRRTNHATLKKPDEVPAVVYSMAKKLQPVVKDKEGIDDVITVSDDADLTSLTQSAY